VRSGRTTGRALLLRAFLLLFSLTIFLATGEIGLRIIYRDAGTRTLGGPGGHTFEHLTVRDDLRGRFDIGPKDPRKPRILIVGDSITWGQGVREWQNVWPEQLALALERAGAPHEMAVLALPGRDIPNHVEQLDRWAEEIQPDIFIYQWYVNDVEVAPHRPHDVRAWQQWPGHERLRRWSYLYYFLDNRLATYLHAPDRSYVQYILDDYAAGSLEWSDFERYFHTLAMRAKELASTRLIVIYPQVPYRGTSPLKPLQDRVVAMTGPHRMSFPPASWIRSAGTSITRDDARWRHALAVPAGTQGTVFETHSFYMPAGAFEVVVNASTRGSGAFAKIEVLDHGASEVLDASEVMPEEGATDGWHDVRAHLEVPDRGRLVRLRLSSLGTADFVIGSIDIPIDYGFKVVDLTEPLNTFNTHASIFDAHPNERAQKVIADKVFDTLRSLQVTR
jgi:hypothetical protein